MNRDRRSNRLTKADAAPRGRRTLRLLVTLGVLGLLAIAGLLLWRTLTQQGNPAQVQIDLSADPSLNPLEAARLAAYIRLNQSALYQPVSADQTTVVFEITPGQDAGNIAIGLLELGLISDSTLFRNYLRYYGLDRQLEAGTYKLSPSMTIPEIALTLTDSTAPEVTIGIPEGWRREQIADWIDTQPDIPFTGADFLAATGAGATVPSDLEISSRLVPAMPLEGFLFPNTYRLAINANAAELVEKMVRNLDQQMSSEMWAAVDVSDFSFYQIITLASIVEREAIVPDERPLIASVYVNRLAAGMMLQADPTVQYAMGYQVDQSVWWNLNLTQTDYSNVVSPYNTYLNPGLPPGPIANPGISSIRAVLFPEESPYLFFRATCDDIGRHSFAVTFEEHVANACP